MAEVSLCMIVKNEISNIKNLLSDVLPALEEVVIVDTGSTDGTLEILKEHEKNHDNLKVGHFEWCDNFSKARNYSFSLATKEWIFWIDGDDRVDTEALKKFKEHNLNDPNVDAWILDYIYSSFPNGDPQIILGRERFLRRNKDPKWVGAIHETVDLFNFRNSYSPDLKVVHNRIDKVIDWNRNIRILEKEFERNPKDPRTAYYYGKELFDRIDPKGIEVLTHYLTLDGRYWDDEVNARFRLAKDLIVKKSYGDAIRMVEPIYHLDSSRQRAEMYWIYGRVEQELGNFNQAIRWYKWCLVPNPGSPRVVSMEYYTWNPMMRLAECYSSLNDVENALEYIDQLQKAVPHDANIKKWCTEARTNIFKPRGALRILEVEPDKHFGKVVRTDSIVLNSVKNLKINSPIFDGIVGSGLPFETLQNSIREGGFLWTPSNSFIDEPLKFGLIGKAIFKGVEVNNYIRTYENLPKLSFSKGNLDFGPYRIRIENLRKSAVKNGYPVVDLDDRRRNYRSDFHISPFLNGAENSDFKVLDVCEWLPNSDYTQYGIQHADAVACCSSALCQLMQAKFPDKNIFKVDDHFEMVGEEWL